MAQQKDLNAGVKALIRSLETAAKNLVLYPETNDIRRLSVAATKELMDTNIPGDSLRLLVNKGQLIYNNDVVFQDKSIETGFVSPLFRDGVHSLEFMAGVPYEEIETFVNLINKFKILPTESDDDIVTAMWEADFQFIKYDTTDEFWETDDSIDIASLKVTSAADFSPARQKNDPRESQAQDENGDKKIESLASLFDSLADTGDSETIGDGTRLNQNKSGDSNERSPGGSSTYTVAQWQQMLSFSNEEKQYLQQMIEAERNRNAIADSLEVLVNIIYCRPDHFNNNQVLAFLVEEVREALTQGNLEDVQKCFMAVMSFSQTGVPSLIRLASEFSRQMSNEDTLKALAVSWENPERLTAEHYKSAYSFLMSLPPDSAASMIPLLEESSNQKNTEMLTRAIAYKAAYATVDLLPLLNKLKPNIMTALINILRSPQLPFPTIIMTNLARSAVSSEVRQAAAEALIENDPGQIKVLFPLIKNANPAVSQMALHYIARSRNTQAEIHLSSHIKNIIGGETRPSNHILHCYKALGMCASQNSKHFLEQTLFRKTFKAFLGLDDIYHRQGAATALLLMPTELGGKALVEKALSSPFKSIREACKMAMQDAVSSNLGTNQ